MVTVHRDFGDCGSHPSCSDSRAPSVLDCAGTCQVIQAVGDRSCDDGTANATAADFNCAMFLFDLLDCDVTTNRHPSCRFRERTAYIRPWLTNRLRSSLLSKLG